MDPRPPRPSCAAPGTPHGVSEPRFPRARGQGYWLWARGQDYLQPCLPSTWPGARHVARGKLLLPPPPVGTAAGSAVGSSSPSAAQRQGETQCHLPGASGAVWAAASSGRPRADPAPPLPAPSPGTRRAPAGPQTPDGAGGAAGQDGAPGRRGCPQPATRHVITDPGNCCAEQSRVGRGTSAGGASENSAPGGY